MHLHAAPAAAPAGRRPVTTSSWLVPPPRPTTAEYHAGRCRLRRSNDSTPPSRGEPVSREYPRQRIGVGGTGRRRRSTVRGTDQPLRSRAPWRDAGTGGPGTAGVTEAGATTTVAAHGFGTPTSDAARGRGEPHRALAGIGLSAIVHRRGRPRSRWSATPASGARTSVTVGRRRGRRPAGPSRSAEPAPSASTAPSTGHGECGRQRRLDDAGRVRRDRQSLGRRWRPATPLSEGFGVGGASEPSGTVCRLTGACRRIGRTPLSAGAPAASRRCREPRWR